MKSNFNCCITWKFKISMESKTKATNGIFNEWIATLIFEFIKTSIVVVCTKVKTFLWEKPTKRTCLVIVMKSMLTQSCWRRSHSFGFTKSFNFNFELPLKFRLKLILVTPLLLIRKGKTFGTAWINKKNYLWILNRKYQKKFTRT